MAMRVPYMFAKKDIIKNFASDIQYENWIAKELRAKRIAKVRKGLYVVSNLLGEYMATKFEIASKIADDAFVCYHSALEYYGVANQVFNTVMVGSKSRFNSFSFDDIEYVRKQSKHNNGVVYIEPAAVRITSLERTVIDCIDDIDFGGGIEEVLNALEQIRILDDNKLLEVLEAYNCVLLYQKAGFILQHFQNKFMFSNEFFAECKRHLTKQVKYFLSNEYNEIVYNSTWQLMAPKNLISHIDGGY